LILFLAFHVLHFVNIQADDLHFAPFYLSSLVANSLLLTAKLPILAPKTLLFKAILPFLAMYFIAIKGFVYAIAVDIYAILPCI